MPKKKAAASAAAPSDKLVGADGAVWYGVDEKKVYDKFHHYDADGNGKLDAQEVVDLSVDLYHAFNPGKELTTAEIKDVHDKLLERIDERHGDHDGTISFEEFLPWYERIRLLNLANTPSQIFVSTSFQTAIPTYLVFTYVESTKHVFCLSSRVVFPFELLGQRIF
eukprot:1959982-Rhodomonas_salina.2